MDDGKRNIRCEQRLVEDKGMEISKLEKPKQKIHWIPLDCECCNRLYDPQTWKPRWSLSGELTWPCPRCGHPNFPRLD